MGGRCPVELRARIHAWLSSLPDTLKDMEPPSELADGGGEVPMETAGKRCRQPGLEGSLCDIGQCVLSFTSLCHAHFFVQQPPIQQYLP
ncbi:hypothetical protein VTH06DRAFT_3659 [Thermothelomyces fergusii]